MIAVLRNALIRHPLTTIWRNALIAILWNALISVLLLQILRRHISLGNIIGILIYLMKRHLILRSLIGPVDRRIVLCRLKDLHEDEDVHDNTEDNKDPHGDLTLTKSQKIVEAVHDHRSEITDPQIGGLLPFEACNLTELCHAIIIAHIHQRYRDALSSIMSSSVSFPC